MQFVNKQRGQRIFFFWGGGEGGSQKRKWGMAKISEGRKGGCQFVLDAIERLGTVKPLSSGHLRDLPKCPL